MTDAAELSLWNQFNLAEDNPDPGGGILYAVRYGTESLLAHRNVVTEVLINSGATICELDYNGLGVDVSAVKGDDMPLVTVLLEELSVVSEAIEDHDAGLDVESIADLSDHLRKALAVGLVTDQLTTFDIANITIPQMVRDIETAHNQNNVLSPEDQTIVRGLGEFAARRAEQIANNGIMIIG